MSYPLAAGIEAVATLTIRLDAKLERQLRRLAKRTGQSRSAIAREALSRQLAVEELHQIRRRLIPHAAAAGYLTDEDVFRNVS